MSIFDQLITDRTQSDVANGTEKGFYNITDLNRVTEAMDTLVSQFESHGFSVPGYVKIIVEESSNRYIWEYSDVPNQKQMNQYLNNLESIRKRLPLLPDTPKIVTSMDNLGYKSANDIEKMLRDVEVVINTINVIYISSGMPWAISGATTIRFAR